MKPTKKSETLEIRLSYPDKKSLREKAAREGRSVSAVLRDLISGYLAEPDECNHSTDWKAHLMTLKHKPKTLIATGFAALALPFTLAPFAAAETVAIELGGEYVSPEGDGQRTRSFQSDVHMEDGDTIDLYFGSGPDKITVSVDLKRIEQEVHLNFRLKEGETVFATPYITTSLDETTTIRIEIEDRKALELTARPSILSD